MTERDAWASIYRLYEEYAPALRQAAALDDDNEMAGKLFSAAAFFWAVRSFLILAL